ncbi:MAG TPA: hypothetical protein VMY35_10555 [Phycisphaerae bacterium]|nr:hypothetical protein [Phycisphaerae bacterium]
MPDPVISEPLDEWVERVIDRALLKHAASCPVSHRVTKLELRFAVLVAFMLGSGVVGGAIGSLLSKVT